MNCERSLFISSFLAVLVFLFTDALLVFVTPSARVPIICLCAVDIVSIEDHLCYPHVFTYLVAIAGGSLVYLFRYRTERSFLPRMST